MDKINRMRIECEHDQPGRYDFNCTRCMARLIASARPVRKLQEGHIAALQQFHKGRWPRIWPEVQELLKQC
jgi:hypothetical protein